MARTQARGGSQERGRRLRRRWLAMLAVIAGPALPAAGAQAASGDLDLVIRATGKDRFNGGPGRDRRIP